MIDRPEALAEAAADEDRPAVGGYILRLFVTGNTPRSLRAIEAVRLVCEEHLQGQYQLDIIDIYQQPDLAASEQLIAAPTLVKQQPAPARRLVGDMTQRDRVLAGLDIATSADD